MKKSEIQVGGHYRAKVSGRIVTVRVDAIREIPGRVASYGLGINRRLSRDTTVYDVTNLTTGRKTTFRSAAKFRRVALPESVAVQRINRIEAKYSTVEGATEAERQEAQDLLQDIGPGMPALVPPVDGYDCPQGG